MSRFRQWVMRLDMKNRHTPMVSVCQSAPEISMEWINHVTFYQKVKLSTCIYSSAFNHVFAKSNIKSRSLFPYQFLSIELADNELNVIMQIATGEWKRQFFFSAIFWCNNAVVAHFLMHIVASIYLHTLDRCSNLFFFHLWLFPSGVSFPFSCTIS